MRGAAKSCSSLAPHEAVRRAPRSTIALTVKVDVIIKRKPLPSNLEAEAGEHYSKLICPGDLAPTSTSQVPQSWAWPSARKKEQEKREGKTRNNIYRDNTKRIGPSRTAGIWVDRVLSTPLLPSLFACRRRHKQSTTTTTTTTATLYFNCCLPTLLIPTPFDTNIISQPPDATTYLSLQRRSLPGLLVTPALLALRPTAQS